MKIFKTGALLFLLFNGFAALAQITKAELYRITPVPPNAASLGKFGAIPVGYYTGIPSINQPVYEINAGRIKVPVGLSYHAGGIRVEELASSVGLGWALNAGGVITRSVKGLPDEVDHEGNVNFFTNYRSVNHLINLQVVICLTIIKVNVPKKTVKTFKIG